MSTCFGSCMHICSRSFRQKNVRCQKVLVVCMCKYYLLPQLNIDFSRVTVCGVTHRVSISRTFKNRNTSNHRKGCSIWCPIRLNRSVAIYSAGHTSFSVPCSWTNAISGLWAVLWFSEMHSLPSSLYTLFHVSLSRTFLQLCDHVTNRHRDRLGDVYGSC